MGLSRPQGRRSLQGRKILVVEDDAVVRDGLCRFLEVRGAVVEHVEGWLAMKARVRSFAPELVIVDHILGDAEAVHLLPELRRLVPGASVVILSGHGSIDLAVRALKSGAEHFLTKPVELPALEAVLVEALGDRSVRPINTSNQSSTRRRIGPDAFVGKSDVIRRLRDQAERLREGDRPVLILGETGTGKSVLARWLHRAGPRADGPLVDLNCATLSKELLESELFGHERGAFTGAQSAKVGLVEAADGGTLFLDEIGDMDLAIQPKLLKVLEERTFRRVGEVRDRVSNVRLISATHQDLGLAVKSKAFRGDLYYRISAFPITMPALRARAEDLPQLSRQILDELAAAATRPQPDLTDAALDCLASHDWPGNIRELRNVLERALWSADDVIDVGHLDFAPTQTRLELAVPSDAAGLTLKELEIQTIERALREEKGRVEAAAKRLGMPRSSLYHRIKTLGLRISKL